MVFEFSEIIDKPKYRTGEYLRFDCPFCLQVRGKEDEDAKLYFHIQRQVGYCFKCSSTVVNKDVQGSFAKFTSPLSQKKEIVFYELDSWTVPVDERGQAYLKSRGLTDALITKYQFKSSPVFDGIIIPNPIQESKEYITDFYQIRNYHPSTKEQRYVSPTKGVKSIYGIHLIQPSEKVVLCEGPFSAISAYRQLGIESLALYGMTLSHVQLSLFLRKKPSSVILMMDGKELESTVRVASQLIPITRTYVSFLEYGKDPDETPNLKEICLQYVTQCDIFLLQKLTKILNLRISGEEKWDRARWEVKYKQQGVNYV